MRRMTLALVAGLMVFPGLAWAGGPGLAPGANIPEKIAPLSDIRGIRLIDCYVVGPIAEITCDRSVDPGILPFVLREVSVFPAAYAEHPGQLSGAAQCVTRVSFSEDGVTFREVAKFTWPPGDFHGMTHVLAVPIGVNRTDSAVMRVIAAVYSNAPDECRGEVKVYGTRL